MQVGEKEERKRAVMLIMSNVMLKLIKYKPNMIDIPNSVLSIDPTNSFHLGRYYKRMSSFACTCAA